MYLLIKPLTDVTKTLYSDHEHFHPGDSGIDLFCPDTIVVNPGETVRINLKIQCEAFDIKDIESRKNVSYYLYPRSSMASRTPLRLANSVGIIDAGYRGDICAIVDNIKTESFRIDQGARLFQICSGNLEPIEYNIVNQLSSSSRGGGGFGSTGV